METLATSLLRDIEAEEEHQWLIRCVIQELIDHDDRWDRWAPHYRLCRMLAKFPPWKGLPTHLIEKDIRGALDAGFLMRRGKTVQRVGSRYEKYRYRPVWKKQDEVLEEEGVYEMSTSKEESARLYEQLKQMVARLGGGDRAIPAAELYTAMERIPECAGKMDVNKGRMLHGAANHGYLRSAIVDGRYVYRVAGAVAASSSSVAPPPPSSPLPPVPPEVPPEIPPVPPVVPPAIKKKGWMRWLDRSRILFDRLLPGETMEKKCFEIDDRTARLAGCVDAKAFYKFVSAGPKANGVVFAEHGAGWNDPYTYRWLKDPNKVEIGPDGELIDLVDSPPPEQPPLSPPLSVAPPEVPPATSAQTVPPVPSSDECTFPDVRPPDEPPSPPPSTPEPIPPEQPPEAPADLPPLESQPVARAQDPLLYTRSFATIPYREIFADKPEQGFEPEPQKASSSQPVERTFLDAPLPGESPSPPVDPEPLVPSPRAKVSSRDRMAAKAKEAEAAMMHYNRLVSATDTICGALEGLSSKDIAIVLGMVVEVLDIKI